MADVETTIRLELVPLVLTKAQVGTLLQVPEDTVENLHRTRQLPAVRVGKHNRWRIEDVRRFVGSLTAD